MDTLKHEKTRQHKLSDFKSRLPHQPKSLENTVFSGFFYVQKSHYTPNFTPNSFLNRIYSGIVNFVNDAVCALLVNTKKRQKVLLFIFLDNIPPSCTNMGV